MFKKEWMIDMMEQKTILIVDDENMMREAVASYLEKQGYHVLQAETGTQALSLLEKETVSFVILDLMLPDISGEEICSRIRRQSRIPIIMLTAKTMEDDMLNGLNLGADDYISKPFSLREVIARVKAVLRRTVTTETERVPERLTYQSLVIDITKKKVSIDDEEVPLTKKEFEILLLLVQNKGRVFSREDILARIWSDEVYVLDRTIDVNITRLRKKIGVYGKCIVTRLGYGYCFEAE